MRFDASWWVPRLAIPILVVVVWAVRSHYPGGARVRHVSLEQLETATKDQLFITYQGIERGFHRFRTEDGRVFLVDRHELHVPVAPPVDQGIGLFVKIQGGKMTVPDPEKMAAWAQSGGFAQHGWDDLSEVERIPPRHLPVVRHDDAPEPTMLVLTSDGDWSEKDLARLESVLDDWLRNEWPGRMPAEAKDDHPASLRFAPEESAADLKTIVIRARNFHGLWCEALADRLVREFPFLWKLEVGRPERDSHDR
jgi:hypothetical protein